VSLDRAGRTAEPASTDAPAPRCRPSS
jgi:hypothetical protein